MQKRRDKAIFFDWDGTAVYSRKTPAVDAVSAMKPLLAQNIKLVIVSGTTIDNIAGGHIEQYFTKEELSNLYLGLGRGAYNYAFDQAGMPYVFEDRIPDKKTLLDIHSICFDIHKILLERYDFPTDIVFCRPNYCKIDLMVSNNRGDQLFLQENELVCLKKSLEEHGVIGGFQSLLHLAEAVGEAYHLNMKPTCDAKYLEVGISSKQDNVDTILSKLEADYGIRAEECSFWGDEYVGIESGIYGSDSFMKTDLSKAGRFFDVSDVSGERPEGVIVVGGGVSSFLNYLK
ncbi:MAG: HAD family hydrolase, partial [Hungatella sp.]